MENDLAMMGILLYNVSSVKAMNFPTLLQLEIARTGKDVLILIFIIVNMSSSFPKIVMVNICQNDMCLLENLLTSLSFSKAYSANSVSSNFWM